MDHALSAPVPVDRRALVAATVAGAAAAVLPAWGGTVKQWSPSGLTTATSFQGLVNNLAAVYDDTAPADMARTASSLDIRLGEYLVSGAVPAGELVDIKATYAQLLVLESTALGDVGDYAASGHLAKVAASIASEIGDAETEGHAWTLAGWAGADMAGDEAAMRAAMRTVRKAYATARTLPAGVGALLDEACHAARVRNRNGVFDAVIEAEKAHARLDPGQWGTPGYPLRTYHPARVKARVGYALAKVGMYREAQPRLEEAADLLDGSGRVGSDRSDVWLSQASVALGLGELDKAKMLAQVAVANEQPRPSAWVTGRILGLQKRSKGTFTDLFDEVKAREIGSTA